MEKRELKFYEAPMVESVEMEVSAPLLALSAEETENIDPGF